MTRDEIMTLGLEEIETRAAQIAEETAEADMETLETLNAELDAIEERKKAIAIETEEKRKAAEAVAAGAGEIIEKREEIKPMENKEIRNTPEYIEAFAKYVRTGKDRECRALLTELGDGVVPVPELVENKIKTAWENDKIFSRITKTYVRGVLKVGFERSATGATMHYENDPDVAEETLVLGIVMMVPGNIKKWITVSDEVLALGAEDFLNYLYDEVTYKIVQAAADLACDCVTDAPTTSSEDHVGVPEVVGDFTPAKILEAIGLLSDQAVNRVFIGSGATIAAVRQAALSAQYAYDPFFGLEVIQKDGLGNSNAIVGDLAGIQANLPEGENVIFKFDDLSLAEKDLVKIVGRLNAAIALVQPGMFVKMSKN